MISILTFRMRLISLGVIVGECVAHLTAQTAQKLENGTIEISSFP